jgi:hypothetical protein
MRSEPLEGEEFPSHYEDRVRAARPSRGTLPPCGVYLMDGLCHVAPRGGEAERRLRSAGALLVAGVTFDGRSVPALTGGGARLSDVIPIPARHAARTADPQPGPN